MKREANTYDFDDMENTDATKEQPKDEFHLFMMLPNELILKLMSYFGSRENIILSKLHSRLFSLCTSQPSHLFLLKKLEIDSSINNHGTIDFAFNNLINDRTKYICVSSNLNGSNRGVTSSLPLTKLILLSSKTPNLVTLKLVGQKFIGKSLNIFSVLPKFLRNLDLSHTFIDVVKYKNIPDYEHPINIEQSYSYFQDIEKNLQQLESLTLDFCMWILPFDLIYIRRLPKLRQLRLRGCRLSGYNIRGTGIHYWEPISVRRVQWRRIFSAIRSSFCKLEVLDITDSDINRDAMMNSLFSGSQISPLRILKMGYYDDDYVWALLGSSINLSMLNLAPNLEVLDVSGFQLELQPGVPIISALQFQSQVIQAFNLKLKDVSLHFCTYFSTVDCLKRKLISTDDDEGSVKKKI